MPVTREQVILAYRMFLGREPESDAVVRIHMDCQDLPQLRQRFLQAPEFISRQVSGPKPRYTHTTLNYPKMEVESDADEEQLADCIAKIKAAWSHLGQTKPHFSVLTQKQFLPQNLNGSIQDFWASGEAEAAVLEQILSRHDCRQLSAMTCVEYGCGVGRVTGALARRFARVHAYDISQSHLLLAEQRIEEVSAHNVELHLCSDAALEQLCECDVFYSRIVFQHNPPPLMKQLITKALSALAQDGIAVFQIPTYSPNYRFRIMEWLEEDHPLDMQMHCLPQEIIFKIVAEANCIALEVIQDHSTGGHDTSNVFVVRKCKPLAPAPVGPIPRTKLADAYAWRLCLALHASEVARAVYLGLMGLQPEDKELTGYGQTIASSRDLAALTAEMTNSDPFRAEIRKRYAQELAPVELRRKRWANPSAGYDRTCLVFLHIQKTAGTSVQHHLGACFKHDEFYREHSDSLHLYSPAELNMFNAFAGHFNYDSLRYIPRKELSIITFVRNPKDRLVSLYHFWRAHEPGHPNFHEQMALANNMPMDAFFQKVGELYDYNTWNHMAWAVMGERTWRAWNAILRSEPNEGALSYLIENTFRPAIARRLWEFTFVGIQEDFQNSVAHLFKILNKPQPAAIRTDHSLEELMRTRPMFKRQLERQPITPEADVALDRLVQLDNIVHGEAVRLHNRLCGEVKA